MYVQKVHSRYTNLRKQRFFGVYRHHNVTASKAEKGAHHAQIKVTGRKFGDQEILKVFEEIQALCTGKRIGYPFESQFPEI